MMVNNNTNIYAESFYEVYREALDMLVNNASYESSPRGLKVKECLNVQLVIEDPYQNLFENSFRGIPQRYLKDELLLYFSGRNDAAGFVKASKFWDKIKTNDAKINSAYGNLIFSIKDAIFENIEECKWHTMSQWDWAKYSLVNDSDTRQAIIHFNRTDHQYTTNKDFVCTMYGIFHIRENKLHFSIFMRSQDIRKGTQFDIPFFTLLQQEMLQSLKMYPKYENLEMGTYTHFLNSLHIYEPDFEIAENMLKASWLTASTPRINESPVLNPEIIKLSHDINYEFVHPDYKDDKFFQWLKT